MPKNNQAQDESAEEQNLGKEAKLKWERGWGRLRRHDFQLCPLPLEPGRWPTASRTERRLWCFLGNFKEYKPKAKSGGFESALNFSCSGFVMSPAFDRAIF